MCSDSKLGEARVRIDFVLTSPQPIDGLHAVWNKPGIWKRRGLWTISRKWRFEVPSAPASPGNPDGHTL